MNSLGAQLRTIAAFLVASLVPRICVAALPAAPASGTGNLPCAKNRISPVRSGPSRLSSRWRKNIPLMSTGKSPLESRAIPHPQRGAYRDRHGRRRGMRWTFSHRLTSDAGSGRQSRVVLAPRRWREPGLMLRITPGTVTKKPDRRRERGISRKTIAQGMPAFPGGPVVTTHVHFSRT